MTDLRDHPRVASFEPGADDGTIMIVRRVLRAQLEIVLHEGMAVTRTDAIEAVHDYRVAMRRTRVVLKVYRTYLPKKARKLQDDLKRLAAFTGPVRDLDVLVRRVHDEQGHSLKAEARSLALLQLLDEHRKAARIRLGEQLGRPRYAHLLEAWADLSSEEMEPHPVAMEGAMAAFAAVTVREVRSVFDRLVAATADFDNFTDDDRIHALRIEAKRLRYLLEFYSSAVPSTRVSTVISRLKRLQDKLGTYQDLRIQAAHLRELASIPGAPIEARLEAVRLTARWESRRIRARQGVDSALRRFTSFRSWPFGARPKPAP